MLQHDYDILIAGFIYAVIVLTILCAVNSYEFNSKNNEYIFNTGKQKIKLDILDCTPNTEIEGSMFYHSKYGTEIYLNNNWHKLTK